MTRAITCDEARELLPGYAFDALEDDGREALEAHLGAGREHDAELVELRATVFALDTLADEREPSGALGARIASITRAAPAVGAADAEAATAADAPGVGVAAAGPPGDAVAAPLTGATARGGRRATRLRWALAAAAVVALVAVFAAGWAVGRGGRSGAAPLFAFSVEGGGGQLVRFSGVAGESPVSVTMAGLQRLDPEHAYELWAIRDGRWMRIGVCNTNAAGGWVGTFPFALRAGDDVALTIEPAGGSAAPSSTPILRRGSGARQG